MTPVTIPEAVIKILRRPLPPEAIKPHPTKKYLSTIKAIYAVERLNEAFGLNGWKIKNELVELHETTNATTGKVNTMVVMKSFLTVPEYGIEVEAYGGNDNEDRGDAYKGACTDALTKICSYIYLGMDVYKGIKSPTNGWEGNHPPEHGGWEGSGSQAAADEAGRRRIEELEQRQADRRAGRSPNTPEPPLEEALQASVDRNRKGHSPKYWQRLDAFKAVKKQFKDAGKNGFPLGVAAYYQHLGDAGYTHSNEFPDTVRGVQAMDACLAAMREQLQLDSPTGGKQ